MSCLSVVRSLIKPSLQDDFYAWVISFKSAEKKFGIMRTQCPCLKSLRWWIMGKKPQSSFFLSLWKVLSLWKPGRQFVCLASHVWRKECWRPGFCVLIFMVMLSSYHSDMALWCALRKKEILNSWNWLWTNSLVMSQNKLVFLSTRWQILGPFSAVCFEFVREWSEMFLETCLRSSSATLKQIAFDFNWY